MVSLKRPGGAAAKKTPRGGVFFFAAAPRGRSLTHCGHGWCLPLAGVVFFFLLRPRPDRGGVFFFAVAAPGRSLTHCGLGRFWQGPGGVFFFFAAAPRERSLTHCGPGWCLPLAGVVFFFLAAAPPGRGGVFFLLWPRPDAHSLTLGWGDFGKAGWCFFFCCGPAGSFLVSLKRPGGAAAKKKTPRGSVFFFAAAPRGRSLTHCGPGWCLPLAGVVFFFLLRPRPDGVVFFFCCGPAQTLTHSLWAGAISARPDGVFFFAVAPPGLFWLV